MTHWRKRIKDSGHLNGWQYLMWAFVLVLIWLTALAVSARAADLPFYCKALTHFERSCTGVKAAAHVLGKQRARWLALHCGATDAEIAEADACFIQITPTEK